MQASQGAKPLGETGLPGEQMVGEREDCLEVALDVEVVVDVRLAHGQLPGRPEHGPHGSRVAKNDGEPGPLAGVGLPDGVVPEADGEITRIIREEILQERPRSLDRGGACPGGGLDHQSACASAAARRSTRARVRPLDVPDETERREHADHEPR